MTIRVASLCTNSSTVNRSFVPKASSTGPYSHPLDAAYGLRSYPQRLIHHRRVPPHHPLGLPAAEGHHDRRHEAPVERHRAHRRDAQYRAFTLTMTLTS